VRAAVTASAAALGSVALLASTASATTSRPTMALQEPAYLGDDTLSPLNVVMSGLRHTTGTELVVSFSSRVGESVAPLVEHLQIQNPANGRWANVPLRNFSATIPLGTVPNGTLTEHLRFDARNDSGIDTKVTLAHGKTTIATATLARATDNLSAAMEGPAAIRRGASAPVMVQMGNQSDSYYPAIGDKVLVSGASGVNVTPADLTIAWLDGKAWHTLALHPGNAGDFDTPYVLLPTVALRPHSYSRTELRVSVARKANPKLTGVYLSGYGFNEFGDDLFIIGTNFTIPAK
jgi:hypothetical protein